MLQISVAPREDPDHVCPEGKQDPVFGLIIAAIVIAIILLLVALCVCCCCLCCRKSLNACCSTHCACCVCCSKYCSCCPCRPLPPKGLATSAAPEGAPPPALPDFQVPLPVQAPAHSREAPVQAPVTAFRHSQESPAHAMQSGTVNNIYGSNNGHSSVHPVTVSVSMPMQGQAGELVFVRDNEVRRPEQIPIYPSLPGSA